jgi:hypothetical protein
MQFVVLTSFSLTLKEAFDTLMLPIIMSMSKSLKFEGTWLTFCSMISGR